MPPILRIQHHDFSLPSTNFSSLLPHTAQLVVVSEVLQNVVHQLGVVPLTQQWSRGLVVIGAQL